MDYRPARAAALARQDESVAGNVARMEQARQRPSALDSMANRLQISPALLKNTLMATVFKGANDTEFAALLVVSEAYGLNPLLKEIYAFPAKGGIAPMVSIDGWISMCNRHPEFDGYEFEDVADDKGKLIGIYCQIFRKDRSRPTRIIEYLDECKRNTDPWSKSPARMLRHRALMQCARYAFGFSGVAAEGDDGDEYVLAPAQVREPSGQAMPRRVTSEVMNETTGEFISTGDEDRDREIQREVDDAPVAEEKPARTRAAAKDRSPDASPKDGSPADKDLSPAGSGAAAEGTATDERIAALERGIAEAKTVLAVSNLEMSLPADLDEATTERLLALCGERKAALRSAAIMAQAK